ncbi:3-deoxy-D-manno-octulosonic acid transferase [Chitinophagaceae bacterium MMS25-I14]
MSVLLYWLGLRLYNIILHIAAMFNPKAKLFVKGRKGLPDRIRYALINERRSRIWMHCASLGEFEQGRPLLEKLRKQYPGHAFVLTFFSPSGYEVRKNYEGADYIFYLPLDSVMNARRFLRYVQPDLCIFVKYELWYYYLTGIARKNIPAILVSAIFREKQSFFQWYGALQRRMLHCFTHIFVQDEVSVKLLLKAGFENVSVSGDTRFDRVAEAAEQVTPVTAAGEFCRSHKIIVAGSTWPADETILFDTMKLLPGHWKLLLVPHEVHESHIAALQKTWGSEAVKWSEWEPTSDCRVLIVDTVGLLLKLYQYATIAWIGGGFGKAGVHNVLEAAVYGKPCFYGPVYYQFLEAKALISEGGAFTVQTAAELAEQILHLEQDTAAYEHAADAATTYVQKNAGATGKILAYLAEKNLISRS